MLDAEVCVDYVFKGLMIHNTCTYISQEDHKMCKFVYNDVPRYLSWINTYSTSMTQMKLRRVVTVTQGAGMVLAGIVRVGTHVVRV